jgi:hypothetical protein
MVDGIVCDLLDVKICLDLFLKLEEFPFGYVVEEDFPCIFVLGSYILKCFMIC